MLSFGEQVKAARNRVRMSQEHLAAQTGISKTGIGDLERGAYGPSIDTIIKVIWVLKVPFEFEYGGQRFVVKKESKKKDG